MKSGEIITRDKNFYKILITLAIPIVLQNLIMFSVGLADNMMIGSLGDVSFVFKNDTIFVFGVVIPSAVITSLCGCPPWVVFACLKCDQVLKCIPAFFKIRRYNWMKNLTRNEIKG